MLCLSGFELYSRWVPLKPLLTPIVKYFPYRLKKTGLKRREILWFLKVQSYDLRIEALFNGEGDSKSISHFDKGLPLCISV